jgi:hypothetical protein
MCIISEKRLLTCVRVPVGQKLLSSPWGGRGKVQPETATKKGRQGISTRNDLHVLCYEHHTEMLLECRSEPAETFLYACREPDCFIHYHSPQGYFIEPLNGDRSEPGIKPGVHCPKDGSLMYLAEVRPEKKSFRLWKCPECDAVRTNGEISSTAASSG